MNEVTIDGLGASGDGVGRLPDGRVVFVPGGLPGDRLRVRLGPFRKRVQFADVLEVVAPSAQRVESRCAVHACGGCALRAYAVAGQGELKRQRVIDNLRRLGGIDASELLGPVRQFGDGWAYRHRVRLHLAWQEGAWRLGYYQRRSRALVLFPHCPVLMPELDLAVQRLRDALTALPHQARLQEVELAYSRRDDRAAARLRGRSSLASFRHSTDWVERSGLSGVDIETPEGRLRHGNLELRYDHAAATEFDLRYEPGVFTQAYPAANDRLVDSVLAAVRPTEGPRVLELHAGMGNLTVPMGRSGARVTAVESNRRAAILCRRNARAAGIEVEVRDGRDDVIIAQRAQALANLDVVLLDPPRTGARAVAEVVAQQGPERVVYVSCDSATLARDASILLAGGYRLIGLDAFDMFPQTPHVETMAVFSRLGPQG